MVLPLVLVMPPLDLIVGSLNRPLNELKSITYKAQLAPNLVSMITPKANSINPLNYFDLKQMITKHESFIQHIIGSSGVRLILQCIILFFGVLPN